MKNLSVVDSVNRKTMQSSVDVYAVEQELYPAEKAALASIANEVRNKRILDIGVGAGRTTQGLLALSQDYIGVDYMEGMVEHCRKRFPGARFEHADARSMPQFADRSFDLIVFSCNGISMVDHEGRLAIFREVRRLLNNDGVFVFSTYNRDGPEYRRWFSLPGFQATKNPMRLALRSAGFLKHLALSIFNRARYLHHEIHTAEYAIINDRCHDYRTMLYYITLTNQRRQLESTGFKADPHVYDLAGREVKDATRDDSIVFLARVAR